MSNQVYANNMEVSCKQAAGKSICAFPDVCFTPPQTPATPPGVPIPYPNTGLASDTTDGSRSVKISGQEVMLKNKSYFKKSSGDEAGSAPMKGVVTHKNMGKVYFNAWSMDVKAEGENLVRMLDITTHNHGSVPGNTPTWPYIDQSAIGWKNGPCKDEIESERQACAQKGYGHRTGSGTAKAEREKAQPSAMAEEPPAKKRKVTEEVSGDACSAASTKPETRGDAVALTKQVEAQKCLQSRRCMLTPYAPASGQAACCPTQTGHHLVEAGSFFKKGRGLNENDREGLLKIGEDMAEGEEYKAGKAPCICVEGRNQYHGTHGLMHTYQGNKARKVSTQKAVELKSGSTASLVCQKYKDARDGGIEATRTVFKESNCSEACLKAQLDAYHNPAGNKDDKDVRAIITGYTKDDDVIATTKLLNNGGLAKFKSSGIPACRVVPT